MSAIQDSPEKFSEELALDGLPNKPLTEDFLTRLISDSAKIEDVLVKPEEKRAKSITGTVGGGYDSYSVG